MAGFLAIVGCGGAGTPSADSETGTTAPESTGPTCTPGTEGCPCDQGSCAGELVCMADECVAVADVDTSSTTIDGSSEAGSTESSSSGEHDSSDATSSDSGSSSSGESSTTEAMPICLEWDRVCVDGVQSTCLNGEWQDVTCNDVCGPFGFTSSGCEAVGNDCLCDTPDDPLCEQGAAAWCTCLDFYTDQVCSTEQFNEYFGECFDGSAPHIACVVPYFVNGQIDCDAALDVCY
jgi:hypothetical protein